MTTPRAPREVARFAAWLKRAADHVALHAVTLLGRLAGHAPRVWA